MPKVVLSSERAVHPEGSVAFWANKYLLVKAERDVALAEVASDRAVKEPDMNELLIEQRRKLLDEIGIELGRYGFVLGEMTDGELRVYRAPRQADVEWQNSAAEGAVSAAPQTHSLSCPANGQNLGGYRCECDEVSAAPLAGEKTPCPK